MPTATLLDGPVDPAALARRPGLYVAPSYSPAFGPALALVDAGRARLRGERYLAGGAKAVAVEVPGRAAARGNPTITIGREFFVTALKDYRSWREKWWRECVQNAVDAGARRVRLEAIEQDDGTMVVACQDDGRGMDEDTLLNKFLVLGGTTKVGASGAAGGFGKAKELLVLPWLGWRVHTRGVVAAGSGTDYEVTRGAPELRGTRLEVRMPADQCTSGAAALAFLAKSDLPKIAFTLTTKSQYQPEPLVREPRARLRGKRLVQEVPGKAEIWFAPGKERNSVMLVRTRGPYGSLYMFEDYVDEIHGNVLVELTGPSVELLTANRDGFRDYDVSRAMRDLANRIAKDTMSALRDRTGLVRKKYVGSGKFRAADRAAAAVAQIGPLPAARRGELALPDAEAERLAEAADAYRAAEEARGSSGPTAALPTKALARELLDVAFRGAQHVENAVAQLVWEPDFFVLNEVEGFRVPRKFLPEGMTPAVLRLARVWTELCRYVLIQLGSGARYGVGFIFSESAAAAYLRDEGDDWLLLNPFVDLGKRKEVWAPTREADLKWLYAAAVHEATHMADGITYHDEAFAAALTRNIARCADGYRHIKRIAAEIPLRGGESPEVE